jgi:glycine/D-amino acid oxidase-like deaminating enzyme
MMAEVAVLGAGFIGLSCAYWLKRDGHRVRLFDPAGPGEGTSYGNAGTFANYGCIPINNPDVFRNIPRFLFSSTSPLRIRWSYMPQLAPWLARFLLSATQARYEHSARALASLLSRAFEGYREMLATPTLASFVRQRECLYLYTSSASFKAAQPSLDLRRSLGVRFDTLDRDAIRQCEPYLAPIFEHGTMFNGSWFLSDPRGFLQALHTSMVAQGLQYDRLAIGAIEPQPNGVRLIDENGRTHTAEYVIVCTGALSRSFARQCGDRVPLDTERGYHVHFPGTSNLLSRPLRMGGTRLLHDADGRRCPRGGHRRAGRIRATEEPGPAESADDFLQRSFAKPAAAGQQLARLQTKPAGRLARHRNVEQIAARRLCVRAPASRRHARWCDRQPGGRYRGRPRIASRS